MLFLESDHCLSRFCFQAPLDYSCESPSSCSTLNLAILNHHRWATCSAPYLMPLRLCLKFLNPKFRNSELSHRWASCSAPYLMPQRLCLKLLNPNARNSELSYRWATCSAPCLMPQRPCLEFLGACLSWVPLEPLTACKMQVRLLSLAI